jgi:glycosyltransferase involved in cell wall biosynthesis
MERGDRAVTRKILLCVNSAWNIVNFRSGLIRALQADGWDVVTAAPTDEHVDRVRSLGCRFIPLSMDNGGTDPRRDLALYRRFRRIFLEERPDVFLGFTIKPNIYGSLAAHSLGIPVINNIAGLGTAFIRKNWLTVVARILYRLALRKSHCVLFQNEDDRRYFVEGGLLKAARTDRVPGSGIDLDRFVESPLPPTVAGSPVRFLFVGRVLRDKGVLEYVEAAARSRAVGAAVDFSILGPVDAQNRTALSRADVDRWVANGSVRYLGVTDDVRPHIEAAHCVVLPSYREGVPRTLLEAASMGRPLIATDAPGCRDVVDDGVNGYLVKVADGLDLADKCMRFVQLAAGERALMGHASRMKAEREFDERLVIQKYLHHLHALGTRTT